MRNLFPAFALAALLFSGCFSTGVFNTAHLTNVQLTDSNYRLVATGVSGEAEAEYLLGFSGSFNTEVSTFAVARLSGKGSLYQEAFDNLWRNFEATNGPVAGRRLALVNVRFDGDALNLIVYTRPHVSIRADVVEFD